MLAHIFRVLVLLALAAHVFYMYCMARAFDEMFGFNPITTLGAALFALVMLVPLVWAVTIAELPEIYLTHTRPRWRWKRRRCPTCGYPTQGLVSDQIWPECGGALQPPPDHVCPECGGALQPPRGYRITPHTIRLFVAINLLAWVLGCAMGEGWMLRDEQLFREEVAVARSTSSGSLLGYSRLRRWPTGDTRMAYSPWASGGFASSD